MTRRFQFARLRRLLESPWTKYFVVAFGLLTRIVALARIGGRFLYYENTAYDRMAVQLLHNVRFSPYWPPGVPYYLMLAHMLFGEGLLVARASILLVYVAFSFGLYALVRELWSRRAANIAVLIFVLYPMAGSRTRSFRISSGLGSFCGLRSSTCGPSVSCTRNRTNEWGV